MEEPSRASSRRALAGGALAALAIAGAGYLLGRQSARAPEPRPELMATVSVAPTPRPTVPIPTPPLGRAELLAAAAVAADASAAGGAEPAALADLVGRRFELRLPFGCAGPAVDETASGWVYEPGRETLRARVFPARLDPGEWLGRQAPDTELIEAFWIERPWTGSEACPPAGSAAATAPAERSVALAQFHGADHPRNLRRDGESFEAVERVAPEALDLARGLRLKLTGRVAAAPGRADPVLCRAPVPAGRPVCLLSVSLEQVAIENPAKDAPLATWDVAAPRAAP